jgi:hypothetical protein
MAAEVRTKVKLKFLLFAIFLSAIPALAQTGVRYDSQVTQAQLTSISQVPVVTVPANPIIAFCNAPASGAPCTNLATTYTDDTLGTACPTNAQIVLSGTNTCVASPDAENNWGVWVAAGQYTYTINIQGVYFGPYYVTAGGSGGGGGGSPGGSNSQLQFNNGGSFGGAAGLTTNSGGTNLSIKGPIPYIDVTAYMPQGGCDDSALSYSPEQGTMSMGSPNLALTYQNGIINGCGVFVANAGAASTLSTPSQGAAPNPSVVGTSGSTTIHYKVAAIDANYGTSAASSAITITTAPSTRTALNYVAINWTSVANAAGYLIYSDQTGGGTYVPLTYSFTCYAYTAGNTCSAIDKGVETHSFSGYQSFWPQTPPASVTNDALITTVVSGGGTNSLVLAANATNAVSGAWTFPDNAPFFQQAMTAAASYYQFAKPQIFVPRGTYFLSTIPAPSSGTSGILIKLAGELVPFGLPIEGTLASGAGTGNVAIDGSQGGGTYITDNISLNCAIITGYPTLGTLFVAANGSINLNNICAYHDQVGIVQASNGYVVARDMNFVREGSGTAYQIDNNDYFSFFDRTNWNASAGCTNDNIPEIWFLGLTNTGHISVFDFRDNAFICHTIRTDEVASGGPIGPLTFGGLTTIEDAEDLGFFNTATGAAPQDVSIGDLTTGDVMASAQYAFYNYNAARSPNPGLSIYGTGTTAFTSFVGSAASATTPVSCRAWAMVNPNTGGSGTESIGYYNNLFGVYGNCDFGGTFYGYDVQTTEVLTSGGNDSLGPAGEMMIGHVFRRPFVTLTCSNSGGSLAAGTYYIVAALLDVAGRVTAPSPEQSCATTGSSGSVAVSVVGGIYFPSSANIYFGTSAGAETDYFNSTSVTNGTVTYTLTTTSGETSGTPQAVGNAMRTWFTEENNGNSCLYCGAGGGLGTGFLGINLTSAQYGSPPSGVKLYTNGLVAMAGLSTSTGSISGSLCQDSSGDIIYYAGNSCYPSISSMTVGSTTIASGTNGYLLYDNSGVLGNESLASLLTSPPAIGGSSPASGAFTTLSASGNVTLPGLLTSGTIAYALCQDSTGHVIASSAANCYSATATSITVGSTTVASGTNGDLLYNNGGVLGNETLASILASPPAIGGASPAAGAFTTLSSNGLPVSVKICSQVTLTMPTGSIPSASTSTAATATCTGLTTSDTISCTPTVNILTVTGFTPSTNGILTIGSPWPTSNTINIMYENNTANPIVPGAVTLNCDAWR